MAYTEQEARRLLIRAGRELTEKGLVARTWGNISARISEDTFLITPSGRTYDSLSEEDFVEVGLADLAWEKDGLKPSSEKGLHAEVYRLRPTVDFIIHTHQHYASVIGITGQSFPFAPVARYALPGTKQLAGRVAFSLQINPEHRAFLMQKHGALCLGETYEEAFSQAEKLEEAAEARYRSAVGEVTAEPSCDLGSSWRCGEEFLLTCEGETRAYPIRDLPAVAPPVAKRHAALYRDGGVNFVLPSSDAEVLAVGQTGRVLPAYLDDFAQIAGETVFAVRNGKNAPLALTGRNAVLIAGAGALCTGRTRADAEAVLHILRKNAAAALYARAVGGVKPLTAADAFVQRAVYRMKYEKQDAKNRRKGEREEEK